MASTRRRTTDFWTSDRASTLVTDGLGQFNAWEILADQEPWQALRQDVIDHNSRGRRIGPAWLLRGGIVTKLVNDDDLLPDRNDGTKDYPRFRAGLFIFADLLKSFRHDLEHKFGKECWKTAERQLDDDPHDALFFRLLKSFSAAGRFQVVEWLESIWRKGLQFSLPGGLQGRYKERDCGIEPLVGTARKLTAALQTIEQSDQHSRPSNRVIDPDHRKRVIIDSAGPRMAKVLFERKSISLTAKQTKLLLYLHAEKTGVEFSKILQALYDARYPETGTPPAKLRTLKKDLNRAMKETFGPPPRGNDWVERIKAVGYRLNASVIWTYAKAGQERLRHTLLPPQLLDGAGKEDEEPQECT